MPHDLALYPEHTIMKYRAIASVPKDWNRWRELVYETVRHFKERYGEAVISQWRFEVWNEPDLNGENCFWWGGSQEDYFRLYDYAVAGAVAAYAEVKIGGPVPSGHYRLDFVSDFLKHVTTQNFATGASRTKVDFISYHTWHEYWKTVDAHFWVVRELAKYAGLENLESINTEFGPTWQFGLVPQPQESENGAAFLARVVSDIARQCHQDNVRFPFAYSWWVLSDIFDEGTYHDDKPFPSCMGLISRQGLKKPAYNVYKMLNMLGTTQLSAERAPDNGSVHGMAAKDSAGGVQILLSNQVNDYPNCTTPANGTDRIDLTVNALPGNAVVYRCYRVDQDNANAHHAWESKGSPSMGAMSADDWNTLRSAGVLQPVESEDALVPAGGVFSRSYDLPREGVLLVTLTPEATGTSPGERRGSRDVKPYRLEIHGRYITVVTPVQSRVRLTALNGRTAYASGQRTGRQLIDKSGLTPGVYLLGVETAVGRWSERIIVAR
jgi:xylan 1,4-beta-xylosidase